MATIELRPEVRAFAEMMEMKLRKHDGDWGESWKTMPANDAITGLNIHVSRLIAVTDRGEVERILPAAADCGNFAMFVADVCGAMNAPSDVGADKERG